MTGKFGREMSSKFFEPTCKPEQRFPLLRACRCSGKISTECRSDPEFGWCEPRWEVSLVHTELLRRKEEGQPLFRGTEFRKHARLTT